ncbi:cyclic nucleotide-binding domain-containing protein [Aquimarina rhabdastrellae]
MDLITNQIIKILDNEHCLNYYRFLSNDLIMNQESDFFTNNLVVFIEGVAEAFCEYGDTNNFLFFTQTAQIHFLNTINVFTEIPLQFSLKATTPCKVIFIPKENFFNIKDTSSLYPILSQDYYTLQQLISDSIINTITKNLDELLYAYLKQKATALKVEELYVHRNELSESLDFSRESISRSLRRLEQQSRVLRKPRSIIITGF